MTSRVQQNAKIDVLCVGYACVDFNFRVDHHPESDEKIRASSLAACGGGPAANAAVAIARLGGSAAFSGYLGDDAFGELHLSEFSSDGVDCRAVFRGPAATPVAAVAIKPDGKRAIMDYREPGSLLAEDYLDLDEVSPAAILLDGHQPLLSARISDKAREAGVPTILDAGSIHDGTMMLYNEVDYLITSEKFARQFTGENDPRLALAAMDGAAPLIAATWGARGVYWQDENGQHHTPAFDIDPVDTTGAGDAFHGAFALGVVRGLTPRLNMRMASATAALTCLKVGARTALPSKRAVEQLSGQAL